MKCDGELIISTHREKLLKYDARERQYSITVLGEESHLAYNRVGLTSFFEHRKVENLYLNSADWVGGFFHLYSNWTSGC